MALQSLILPIISLFRSAGINQAANALKGLGGQFNSLSGQIGAAAASFSAFQALSTARVFTVDSVAAANLFERNLLGLNQVFEDLQPRIVGFTKEVESYGLSQSQAAQASVFLGSVLKQYGFSVGETAFQTERLVTLSQDLATTYGYDVSEALLAVTALFRGEYDPIEKFGVAMKQNEVNARLAAQGLNDLEGAELANAQAIARLEMLFERAGDSIGAFSRASDTLYGSQQRLNAVIGNLQLAVGAPLQKPLAEINNLFADIFEENGPAIVQIFESLATSINVLAPSFGELLKLLLNVLGPLQQVIDLLNLVLMPVFEIINPVLATLNELLSTMNDMLDLGSAALQLFGLEIQQIIARMEDNEVFGFYLNFFGYLLSEGNPIVQVLSNLGDGFEYLTDKANMAAGTFYDDTTFLVNGVKRMSAAQLEASQSGRKLEDSLKAAATGAVDAEGKLGGLAGVFKNIQDEIDKSKAKQSLEDLGLSAAFIEEALTRPNWKEIFEVIQTYAKLAAIDITKVLSLSAAVGLSNTKAELEKRLNELFAATDPKAAGNKTGKSFFEGLNDEVAKQAATSKLTALGASKGLIEAILGAENWEATYKRIVSMSPGALAKLQARFNQTAEGISEAADALAEFEEKLKRIKEVEANITSIFDALIPKEELPEFQSDVNRAFDALKDQFRELQDEGLLDADMVSALSAIADQMQKVLMDVAKQRDDVAAQIESTKERLEDIKDFKFSDAELEQLTKPISLIAETVSEYEQQVTESVDLLLKKIAEGAERKIFTPQVANDLRKLVDESSKALTEIARIRLQIANEMKRMQDALAFREATKEAVLAFADITKITSIAAVRLQDAIKKSGDSTTEIIAQTVKSARNARDYRVILIRELEGAKKASTTAEDITANLKKMLDETKAFATSLSQLQSLGLTPALLQEIASAGTEIGLELARALIAGGPAAIAEINRLYTEIGQASVQAAANSIGSGLQKIIDDASKFAANLNTLVSMGLNTKVFQQIVEAGVEVGGATAEAIIAGGPQVVTQINELYKKISTTADAAATIAADKLFDLSGKLIESVMEALRERDAELSKEASGISQKMVDAFQKSITDYTVDLSKLLTDLQNKKTELEGIATTLGNAFSAKLGELVANALNGLKPNVDAVAGYINGLVSTLIKAKADADAAIAAASVVKPKSEFTAVGEIGLSQAMGAQILIDSVADVARVIAYLTERIDAANKFANEEAIAGRTTSAMQAIQTRDMFKEEISKLRSSGFTGQPTVININVKTDTTQSTAMVGRTIGNAVTKYVTTGGGVLVSPIG